MPLFVRTETGGGRLFFFLSSSLLWSAKFGDGELYVFGANSNQQFIII
jgi:hypothetical protein